MDVHAVMEPMDMHQDADAAAGAAVATVEIAASFEKADNLSSVDTLMIRQMSAG